MTTPADHIAAARDSDGGRAFYERRYAEGYMDDWTAESKARVREVLGSMHLPDEGTALDFGCGTGVFTRLLKEALPKWVVYGADISRAALRTAAQRHRDCRFFDVEDPELAEGTFDLVFSNHVLEHVPDLSRELQRTARYSKIGAAALHILPCGNEGSFEHGVCRLVKNGIGRGDRFFFEDEGHVRRLTTNALRAAAAPHGMELVGELYANQHFGAVRWITADPRNVRKIFDPAGAVDPAASARLRRLRAAFLALSLARLPSVIVRRVLGKRWNRRPIHFLLFAAALPLFPLSVWVDLRIERKAAREWRDRKFHRNGSEMYLIFRKAGDSA